MKTKKFIAISIAVMVTAAVGLSAEQYPYVAKVTGEKVNIRAGAGVNHYRCGRVSSPDTVVVIGEQFGFAKIRPPKGSFSWIAKQYVDKKSDTTGEVNTNDARVWVGSPYVSAIHSSSLQTELNKGQKVTFSGKPEGDYYKIEPPKGAAVWINSSYLEKMGPLSKYSPEKEDMPKDPETASKDDSREKQTGDSSNEIEEGLDIELDEPLSEDVQPEEKQKDEPEDKPDQQEEKKNDKPKKSVKELDAIDEYLEASAKIQEEKKKPLAVQDYTEIKKTLEQIASEPENGRAVTFAKALLDVVERYQAAKKADEAIREQDSELVKVRSEIQKNRKKQIEQINSSAGYVMVGTIKKSYVYTTETGEARYVIRDENDRIKAYAVADDYATKQKAEKLLGKRVGLNGEVSPDVNTSKVLIEFDEIKEIWKPENEK